MPVAADREGGTAAQGTAVTGECGRIEWAHMEVALLMGRVEMGISGRVFGWGLFEWVEMGCRDLRVGAGCIC